MATPEFATSAREGGVRNRSSPQFPASFDRNSVTLSPDMDGLATGGTAVAGGRCATCDAEIVGSYCHQCGEPRPHDGDLAARHLLHDALHDLTRRRQDLADAQGAAL